MIRILEYIWDDIKHGENIDLYITVAIAIPLAIFSTLGLAQLSWTAPLTLTVLALFAISLLVNRRKMEAIQQHNEKLLWEFEQKNHLAFSELFDKHVIQQLNEKTIIDLLREFEQKNHLAFSELFDELRYLAEKEKTGFQRIYSDTNDEDFVKEIRHLIRKADEIKIYSIAISVLWDHQTFRLLEEAIKTRRTKVTILIADPKSPQIRQRLKEEQEYYYPAPKGADLINGVFKSLKKLEASVGDTGILDVRQFGHYPTFTLIIIDKDIFCYPYGYQTVGTEAPVLHLRDTNSLQAIYFRRQFELLLKNCPRMDDLK
jgi:hypothetical protein